VYKHKNICVHVGVGLLAVGGPAGIAVATVGAGIGAAGLAGSWISKKIGQGMGWGFNMAGAHKNTRNSV
jgi:hypothetical protein